MLSHIFSLAQAWDFFTESTGLSTRGIADIHRSCLLFPFRTMQIWEPNCVARGCCSSTSSLPKKTSTTILLRRGLYAHTQIIPLTPDSLGALGTHMHRCLCARTRMHARTHAHTRVHGHTHALTNARSLARTRARMPHAHALTPSGMLCDCHAHLHPHNVPQDPRVYRPNQRTAARPRGGPRKRAKRKCGAFAALEIARMLGHGRVRSSTADSEIARH